MKRSIVCLAFISLLLSFCAPSAEERERRSKLAKVKRIAVVTIVGKSSVSPTSTEYRRFTDELLIAFQKAAAKAPPVIEFLPVDRAVNDPVYRRVAKIRMPEHAYSPVEGLTYVYLGTAGGFDCGPLLRSLNADAVLFVLVDYGLAVRDNGSSFHLIGNVESRLIGAPEVSLWRGRQSYEESLPVTIFTHPKLAGSIGAKWVVSQRPSTEEYGELMKAAGKTKLPATIGTALVESLVSDVKKARKTAA